MTAVFIFFATLAWAGVTEPAHVPITLVHPVADKNLYLLTAWERTPILRDAIRKNEALSALTARRLASLDMAAKTCALDLVCNTDAFRWSAVDIDTVAGSLAALYKTSPAVRAFSDGPLRKTGMYAHDRDLAGGEFLAKAWREAAAGMNLWIDIYGLGKPPRYPAIDSMMYDPATDLWKTVVRNLVGVIEDDRPDTRLFFDSSLRFATELLLLNHRDEAGRLEPMESGENKAAFQRVKLVKWARYPYSVIVVPGSGADRAGVRLSPNGLLRDDLAAKRFYDGKAPFILVSGGFVHPDRTEFAEAIEMKRDLMTRYGIPAGAILVDPHARHTTTNLRNAARILYRYGFPFAAKALITTDTAQSASIEGPPFASRCIRELGYLPYRLTGRISPVDLEFVPTIDSLQIDPADPLDP